MKDKMFGIETRSETWKQATASEASLFSMRGKRLAALDKALEAYHEAPSITTVSAVERALHDWKTASHRSSAGDPDTWKSDRRNARGAIDRLSKEVDRALAWQNQCVILNFTHDRQDRLANGVPVYPFDSTNPGSLVLDGSKLKRSKELAELRVWSEGTIESGYEVDPAQVVPAAEGTTDLFFSGHTSWVLKQKKMNGFTSNKFLPIQRREPPHDHRYLSPAKLAKFIALLLSHRKGEAPVRIWLMGCYAGRSGDSVEETLIDHLARKLPTYFVFNVMLFGFTVQVVGDHMMRATRDAAVSVPISNMTAATFTQGAHVSHLSEKLRGVINTHVSHLRENLRGVINTLDDPQNFPHMRSEKVQKAGDSPLRLARRKGAGQNIWCEWVDLIAEKSHASGIFARGGLK